jgi:hypothetical protein
VLLLLFLVDYGNISLDAAAAAGKESVGRS